MLAATAAGVYWFGVHALGDTVGGRDDGRRRPGPHLHPAGARRHDPDGRHRPGACRCAAPSRTTPTAGSSDVGAWARTLDRGGRLRRARRRRAAAGDRPLTWLVDPAVTDAARRLAARQPGPLARHRPTTPRPGDDRGRRGVRTSPSDRPSADPARRRPPRTPTPEDAELAAASAAGGATGSTGCTRGSRAARCWPCPYGDLDVSAAADARPAPTPQARKRTGTELGRWGLPITPGRGRPARLPDAAAHRDDRRRTHQSWSRTRCSRARRAVGGADATATSWSSPPSERGHRRTRPRRPADPGRAAPAHPQRGRAAPADARAAAAGRVCCRRLGARHRATASSTGSTSTGSTSPRSRRDPRTGPRARSTPTGSTTPRRGRPSSTPSTSPRPSGLARAGGILQNLLTAQQQVGGTVRDEAMTDVSYADRRRPARSRASAARSRAWISEPARLGRGRRRPRRSSCPAAAAGSPRR